MIQAWRVIKKKHLSDALSGEGARLGGGRWNHAGIPVVYASETLSLAVLELFIHFTRRDITISKSLLAIPVLIPDTIKTIEDPCSRPGTRMERVASAGFHEEHWNGMGKERRFRIASRTFSDCPRRTQFCHQRETSGLSKNHRW